MYWYLKMEALLTLIVNLLPRMQEEGLCLHNYFNVCTRVTFAGGWLFPFEYVLSGLHLKILRQMLLSRQASNLICE